MIGPQLGRGFGFEHLLDDIATWNPYTIFIHNPGQGAAAPLRARMSSDNLFGRVAIEDHIIEQRIRSNWQEAANWALSLILHHATGNSEIRAWAFTNEIMNTEAAAAELLGKFSLSLTQKLADHGLKHLIGGFSVGTPPTPDEGDYWNVWCEWWEQMLPYGAIQHVHEYYVIPVDHTPPWWFGRFQKLVRPHLDAQFRSAPFYLGETGIDLQGNKKGWRTAYNEQPAPYLAHLVPMANEMATWQGCQGGALYLALHSGGWDDFDFSGHMRPFAVAPWPSPAPVPTPPAPTPTPTPPPPTPEPPMSEKTELLRGRLAAHFGSAFSDLRDTLPKHETLEYSRRPLSAIEGYAVHHTGNATTRGTSWTRIAEYHVNSNNWPGVAYCLGFRLYNGTVEVALLNDLETISYHVGDANRHQLALCLMGDFTSIMVDPLEIKAMQDGVKILDGVLAKQPAITPHSRWRSTTCPANVKHIIPTLRVQPPPPPTLRFDKVAFFLEEAMRRAEREDLDAESDHIEASALYQEAKAKR